jgi:protein-tyrosine phosphatase
MKGFIDLHCHWIAGIDDGARSFDEGVEMLRRLGALGFSQVIATPHMRPGMFENEKADLVAAFERMHEELVGTGGYETLPRVDLSSEHYCDEKVLERIFAGNGLPYPGGRAVLLEFYDVPFSAGLEARLFDLQRRGFLPVIAHPERYRTLWDAPERLERLVDLGSVALLDACSVTGKYGSAARKCALELLERELYQAACSDAHRPADVDELERAMSIIEDRYDAAEVDFLFREGPAQILAGQVG